MWDHGATPHDPHPQPLPTRGRGEAAGVVGVGRMTQATPLTKSHWFPLALGLGSFVLFIVAVELLIRIGAINRFIVPMPSEILRAFPRVVLEEDVLSRFLLTAGEAFSASILVALSGVAGGLRLGLIFALINIVGVEFLINFGGLGQLINELAERYDLAGTYASICFVILVSVCVFMLTERLERWLRPVH